MKPKIKLGLSLFINPFVRIAGWPALLIGLAAMALTAIVGKINHVAFDGVLDIHSGATFDFTASLAMQAVDFLSLFLTLWLAGVLFSKSKLRMIDVAGTVALSRIPFLLFALVCFLPVVPENMYDFPRLIIMGLISFPFIVWFVVLLYNAYSVSCNVKGSKAVVTYIGALLIAWIVSKVVLFVLAGSLFANMPVNNLFKSVSKENIEALNSLTVLQKTENVVKAFEQGKLDAMTVYFDEKMKSSLTPTVLQMTWLQVNMTWGKFEKAEMDSLKMTQFDNYQIVVVPFIFQKEKRYLQLSFNSEEEVSGLFLK